jgi:membrane protease subunit (stomatin/prohibitin family)
MNAMGIIRATFDAVGGALADSWQEVIEADGMTDTTVMTCGKAVRKSDRRFGNRKGSEDLISNGSVIHVYPNQFMMLVDGGKVVDFTAEEGYYKVENSSAPSLFAGQFGKSLSEAFSRIKYSGVPSSKQIAVFINLQEIKGIRFGTRSPINYFDDFYNSELFLRAHGTYSIKITDPLRFFSEVVPKTSRRVEIGDINEQYLAEFLEALQSAINRMSADGVRISYVASKGRELSRYMAEILDADWREMRGMEVQAVGIASISYDEESQKLINMRNQGAMLGDPSVREGYIQGAMARGLEAAGSNPNGSTAAFMGMGVGMGAGGAAFSSMSASNREQMAREESKKQASAGWRCDCGAENSGKFCAECGKPRPCGTWRCDCGAENSGKFCAECGKAKPSAAAGWFCTECGKRNEEDARFCPDCGKKRP